MIDLVETCPLAPPPVPRRAVVAAIALAAVCAPGVAVAVDVAAGGLPPWAQLAVATTSGAVVVAVGLYGFFMPRRECDRVHHNERNKLTAAQGRADAAWILANQAQSDVTVIRTDLGWQNAILAALAEKAGVPVPHRT